MPEKLCDCDEQTDIDNKDKQSAELDQIENRTRIDFSFHIHQDLKWTKLRCSSS